MLRIAMACLVVLSGACTETAPNVGNGRLLVLTFPDSPNPPTKNLIRGGGNLRDIKESDSLESLLSEALLRCGVKSFFWRELASHGQTLVLDDNEQNRAAVKCAAKAMPIDFYMQSESRG